MKAVVFHAIGDIRLEEVPKPELQGPEDAIVRLTTVAICGTDLHFVRGTMEPVTPGTILGHEGVGVVEAVGEQVRNFKPGDRVVLPSTIACGSCAYCRAGEFSQCDVANPAGKRAGTAFYGGPQSTGSFAGMQAEFVRVPYAHTNMIKLPDEVSDAQAVLISDIFPTGYFGADIAGIRPGDTVAVFGCGPVGQFAIASARLLGATRIFAIDQHRDRLAMAQRQGAEIIDFAHEDPVECLLALTAGTGVDKAIDAVGVEAQPRSPAQAAEFAEELDEVAPHRRPKGPQWQPGEAPSQVLRWAVQALAKAGTLAIIGVYPPSAGRFPIGEAMNKNLRLRMGNCNHRAYIPRLLEWVRSGVCDPAQILTQQHALDDALQAYHAFDLRQPDWLKVALHLRQHGEAAQREDALDAALQDSFPASDAVAKM